MDLGEIVGGIFDWIFTKILDFILTPFINGVESTFFTEEAINNLQFVDSIYEPLKSAGLALLILITMWQAFKAMFAFMGFEAEEPAKIGLKSFVFGFLLLYSKDIMMYGFQLTGRFAHVIMEAMTGHYDTNFIRLLSNGLLSGGTLFSFDIILAIYVVCKSIGLFFRMYERLIMSAMLIIFAPLAFACGVSQPTKGFLVGFIKVFVGNLVTQLVQIACISALTITWISRGVGGLGNLTYYFLTIGIIKISGKIEEIVREMSISAGIGKDAGGAFRNLSTMAFTARSVIDISRAFRK